MADAWAVAISGGCRRKRDEVDDEESLPTKENTVMEKKVKGNCWETSEDAYVEGVREERRARSLKSQATRAMVAKILAKLDDLLYELGH